jgi:lipopolysaccharide transport system ATP-binding protein
MSVAISVKNLSKQYRLGYVNNKAFIEDTKKLFAKIAGKKNPYLFEGVENDRTIKSESNYVWSLKDINFEVNKGDVIGIIGRNGAGKSTLLKILSKVTSPTQGEIKIKGRVASLLEVGTGFHPELTGKENIFLNGAILGMKKSEIKNKLDEIIQFAGIEKYVDTPVKRYSSGMYVRLAFAVAAHLENEILIIDEVLAVGDTEFQEKCLGKMKDVSQSGRTVVFVSHIMSSVKDLCNNGILLENGTLKSIGNINDVINDYVLKGGNKEDQSILNKEDINQLIEGLYNKSNPTFIINKIAIHNSRNEVKNHFFTGEEIHVSINFEILEPIFDFALVTEILDEENRKIITSQSGDSEDFVEIFKNKKLEQGTYNVTCKIPSNLFGTNKYGITIQLINKKNEHVILNNCLSFKTTFEYYNNDSYFSFEKSLLRPKFDWTLID